MRQKPDPPQSPGAAGQRLAGWVAAFSIVICVPALAGQAGPSTFLPTFAPAPGLSLAWLDCPGGPAAVSDLVFACDDNASSFALVCSVVMAQPLAGVIGAEMVVDLQHSAASLPDWWRLDASGTGGCRTGSVTTGLDWSASAGCTDAWQGRGFSDLQGFTIGLPDHPSASQARLKPVAGVLSSDAVTLGAGVTLGLIQIVIHSGNTVAPGLVCAGCAGSACLVFNSAWLRVLPGQGADVLVTGAALPGSNWATWRGSGADCSLVPARHSTWGQIKSLYR
mgnify:CR=1 FL=1